MDDDIPTVTGSSTTIEIYESRDWLDLPFNRTGDVSGLLLLNYLAPLTEHRPAPSQDSTTTIPGVLGWRFQPGVASNVSITELGFVKSLGKSGTVELLPHHCPGNDPRVCEYYPQYQVGTPSEINFNVYSALMGVRIEADQASVGRGRRQQPLPCTATGASPTP